LGQEYYDLYHNHVVLNLGDPLLENNLYKLIYWTGIKDSTKYEKLPLRQTNTPTNRKFTTCALHGNS